MFDLIMILKTCLIVFSQLKTGIPIEINGFLYNSNFFLISYYYYLNFNFIILIIVLVYKFTNILNLYRLKYILTKIIN